jgi:Rab GDP dissociation inhibitor
LSWRSSFDKKYDAIVVGSGPSESLLSSLLAANGKTVLQLEPNRAPGGVAASMDLQKMYERMGAPGAKPEGKLKLGSSEEYSADVAPKVLMAGGKELQMLVSSGLWQQMDFRRVHRSFLYRTKPGGAWDVHRVLVTAEDVLKTRSIPSMEKAKLVQMLAWLDKFDEANPTTYTAGKIQKKRLNLAKMSAASFFRYGRRPHYPVTPSYMRTVKITHSSESPTIGGHVSTPSPPILVPSSASFFRYSDVLTSPSHRAPGTNF